MTAIFHSVFHPGEVPFGLVLARAQAQPVALALLGVFVAATVAVLQGEYVLDTLLWAAPITYAAAVAWTIYDLHRRPAAGRRPPRRVRGRAGRVGRGARPRREARGHPIPARLPSVPEGRPAPRRHRGRGAHAPARGVAAARRAAGRAPGGVGGAGL